MKKKKKCLITEDKKLEEEMFNSRASTGVTRTFALRRVL